MSCTVSPGLYCLYESFESTSIMNWNVHDNDNVCVCECVRVRVQSFILQISCVDWSERPPPTVTFRWSEASRQNADGGVSLCVWGGRPCNPAGLGGGGRGGDVMLLSLHTEEQL